MKYLFLLLCFCPLIGFAQPEKAPLVSYAEKINQVKTLQSHFTEEKHLSVLSQPLESSGRFSFDKQVQQLIWIYEKPFQNGFLIEQDRVFRLKNKQKEPVKQAAGKMMAAQILVWLTLDFETLQKDYLIAADKNVLTFTPRQPAHKVVKQITVWLDEKNPQIIPQVKLEEPNGDFTVWHFEGTRINTPLPEELP